MPKLSKKINRSRKVSRRSAKRSAKRSVRRRTRKNVRKTSRRSNRKNLKRTSRKNMKGGVRYCPDEQCWWDGIINGDQLYNPRCWTRDELLEHVGEYNVQEICQHGSVVGNP